MPALAHPPLAPPVAYARSPTLCPTYAPTNSPDAQRSVVSCPDPHRNHHAHHADGPVPPRKCAHGIPPLDCRARISCSDELTAAEKKRNDRWTGAARKATERQGHPVFYSPCVRSPGGRHEGAVHHAHSRMRSTPSSEDRQGTPCPSPVGSQPATARTALGCSPHLVSPVRKRVARQPTPPPFPVPRRVSATDDDERGLGRVAAGGVSPGPPPALGRSAQYWCAPTGWRQRWTVPVPCARRGG